MNPNRIAFCITCKGRTQHLKQTLPQNLRDNANYANCVFVLLDYGSPDDLLEWLRCEHALDIAAGRLAVYSTECAGAFRMAHAKNMAHRLGLHEGGDILVNLDADNFTGPGFASYLAKTFQPGTFLWARMIQQCRLLVPPCAPCVLERGHAGPHSAILHENEEARPRKRGISGRIVVHRMDFLKVGGYDERFNDWGPDDKDFNLRLQALGLAPVEIPGQFLHAIHHGPKLRYREYPHVAKTADCYEAPLPPAQTCVANFGHFGCGWVRHFMATLADCFELKPVPTRIFGIGMHKTGTTSLYEALNILHFDCAHWNTPRWARTVWRQIMRWGFSPAFEKHYSATDFPITMLFKELDRAYPGSKFILTLRDEDDWLRSVRDHFSYEKNPYRKDWDWDCFSHHLHDMVYGRRDFNASVMLARYWRHNADVIEYFKDRPGDLLVMRKPRWEELCQFLNVGRPDCAYPRANGTPGGRQ